MNNRTEMMLPPTLEECFAEASKLKPPLPASEAEMFFHHYQSVGWKVGKLPMKSFVSAMAGWHVRWKVRSGLAEIPKPLSGADKMIRRDEYNRVVEKMKSLWNQQEAHSAMRPDVRAEYEKLKARREQLRKELGIVV